MRSDPMEGKTSCLFARSDNRHGLIGTQTWLQRAWAEFGSAEEYEHSGVDVKVFAYGAEAASFDGFFDNTELGTKLFYAVSGSGPN